MLFNRGGCGTIDSNPPNYINGSALNWCVACGGSSFQGSPGDCFTTLPVSFISFSAKYIHSFSESAAASALTWVVSNQSEGDYFLIEKSLDGIRFTSIARVDAARYKEPLALYSYNETHPSYGQYYYRIRQIGRDGDFSLSKTISLAIENEQLYMLSLSPNPNNGKVLTLRFNAFDPQNLRLIDILGNSISEQHYRVEFFPSTAVIQFTPGLRKGMYYVQMGLEGKKIIKKLVVH